MFAENVLSYGFHLEFKLQNENEWIWHYRSFFSEFRRRTMFQHFCSFLMDKAERQFLFHQIKLEMTSDIFSATKHLRSFQVQMWQTDGCEAMLWRISDWGTHVQPRLWNLVLPQQQAIEDLQSEEEKVNLLTKEKTKLQMQAEDVRSYFAFWLYCWYGVLFYFYFKHHVYCVSSN